MTKGDLLVVDRPQKLQARSNFQLGFVCLNYGADDGDVNIFRADVMS